MSTPETSTTTAASVRHALELARDDIDTALQALADDQHVPLGVAAEVAAAVSQLSTSLERLANATMPATAP
jgi:hypothetical protein